ncbi:hypothetical protein FBU30_005795 [Linnemannia zychae]|nr:hypothetical protein FBU30_005795 [Linnemannia zychae]
MNSQGLTGKDSKNNSPPSSSNGSRRSSLVDLPKAFLSSLRRSSLSGSSDSSSSTATSSTSSIAGSGASNNMGGGMMQTFGIGTIAEECSEEAQVGSKIVMAIPKAPPQDTHAQYPLLKSILKKQLSDAILDGTPASNGNASSSTLGSVESSDRTINSETVHPMVEGAIEGLDINLLTPIDHRARLLTHSPVPNQQHLSHIEAANVTTLPGKTGPYNPNNYFDSISSSDNMTQPAQISSRGAAIPSDFTPGMQPNLYRNRGGEQEPGSVRQTMTQEDMLTEQMLSISPRAQDLAKQYYNVNPNQNSQTSQLSEPIAVTVATAMGVGRGGVGGNRRCINFHETVEIIPAYKKSEYNRQGDKYATFKILTPDMKSEIRDELNNYKMREMAVHVESMGNTAFH